MRRSSLSIIFIIVFIDQNVFFQAHDATFGDEDMQFQCEDIVFLDGKLPQGLEWAGEPEVFPETIEVDGPRDVVNSMRTVRSMEMDVSELEEGVVQREIPLVGAPANTSFEAQTVLVTLRVQPKMKERVLSPLRVDAEGVVPLPGARLEVAYCLQQAAVEIGLGPVPGHLQPRPPRVGGQRLIPARHVRGVLRQGGHGP